MQCFEDETQNLVLDELSDGQPVQSTQGRDDMIILLQPAHHPSCRVLHELQPVKKTVGEIVKEAVLIVQLGDYQRQSQCGC